MERIIFAIGAAWLIIHGTLLIVETHEVFPGPMAVVIGAIAMVIVIFTEGE